MPGPNDFHFDKSGQMLPGLGPDDPRNGTETFISPPRKQKGGKVDGRTKQGRQQRAAAPAAATEE